MKILLLLSLLLTSLQALASADKSSADLAVGVGFLITARIKGVDDSYTAKGFHFSHKLYSFRPEWSAFMAEKDGVRFYNAGLSLRFSMDDLLSAEDRINLYWIVGLGYTAHKPVIDLVQANDYKSKIGGHLGYGLKFYFAEKLSFKLDGRMHIEPGRFFNLWTSLSLDF